MSYAHFIGADEIDEPLMVPGMGAQPVQPPKYVADNDNDELATTTFGDLPAYQDDHPPIPGQRIGDFMQVYSGGKFWPLDPRADEIHIEDIAHALSLQCRYAGHCKRFYSVAEHSVHIAWWLFRHAGAETALCGLLHDASEAYILDVIRPLKPHLTNYRAIEAKVMAAVCERFGLPAEMPRAVKETDDWIIADEIVNMAPMEWHARYRNPLGVTLGYWAPEHAERRFLDTFAALSEAAEAGRLT